MTARLKLKPAGLKKKIKRLFLYLIIGCILGEAGVRIYEAFTHRTGSLYDQIVINGERFKLKPNSLTVAPERYGDIAYQANEDGYRDSNYPASDARAPILWLGDSVSFGLGVEQAETFVARVQNRLEERLPERYRVRNLSMFAYHTGNELDAFKEDGLKFKPRLVVLQFYMNDFPVAPIVPATTSFGQRLTAVKNRLIYKSALYRRIDQLVSRAAYLLVHDYKREHSPETLNNAEPVDKMSYLASHPSDDSVEAFQKIKEIARLARDNGAEFLLIISPDETQLFTTEYDSINKRIRQFCEREQYLYIDPLDRLRNSDRRLKLYHDGVHFSPEGHELMGRVIFEDLSGKGVLERVARADLLK